MVFASLIDSLDPGLHVPDEFGRHLPSGLAGEKVMPHIHKRIPLVMSGAIRSHPRSYGFFTAKFDGLRQVFLLSGEPKHLESSQLHIVGPVVLLVDVGGTHRCCLAIAGQGDSGVEARFGFSSDLPGELRVERPQNLGTESKVGSVFPRGAGYSRRGVLKAF